ncbi:putative LRR receptor-like serine/threonine-protein kinase [Cardamine amara subsp. amara]|uniref:LRR receptor-like serine/threonine-protein kinase n=1 Tax=Cardamine amara subsp. amara TaxID=228776 RepID=A0ABD1AWK8_CARAN
MKSIHGFLLLLITAYGIFESVQAQDQSGFISLSCGLVPKETTYTEKTTNIKYTSDANYTDSGLVGRINDAYKTQFQQQTWTLRSFPKGERNCYNFNLTANSKYLIRGTFVYGNYDGLNQIPNFDLHIGPNKWTSVILDGVADASIFEMIHVLAQDRLQVCLVIKTGETIPFISSLELRPLNNNTYVTQSGSLIMVSRYYFSPTPNFVRYYRTNYLSEKSDVYSFGVVLLEIVTNQPVIDKTRERYHISEWVGFMLTKGDIRSIVDPKLMGDYDTNCAWKIVELALGCLNPSSNQRPTMAHVVNELNECVALENARRQGSEEMYSMGSIDYSRLSSVSEFTPRAR